MSKHQVSLWLSPELYQRWEKSGKRIRLAPLLEEALSRELTKIGY